MKKVFRPNIFFILPAFWFLTLPAFSKVGPAAVPPTDSCRLVEIWDENRNPVGRDWIPGPLALGKGGQLYVVQNDGKLPPGRIHVIGPDSRYIETYDRHLSKLGGELYTVSMAVEPNGNFLLGKLMISPTRWQLLEIKASTGEPTTLKSDSTLSYRSMRSFSKDRAYIQSGNGQGKVILERPGKAVTLGLGDGPDSIQEPADLIFGMSGNLYVLDREGRVLIFNSRGKFRRSFPLSPTQQETKGNLPQFIQVSPQGQVVVGYPYELQAYSAGGKKLWDYGRRGQEIGEFYGITDMALRPDGFLFVSDHGVERIQIFKLPGFGGKAFAGRWPEPASLNPYFQQNPLKVERIELSHEHPIQQLQAFTVDPKGFLWVAADDHLFRFSLDGDWLGQWDASPVAGTNFNIAGILRASDGDVVLFEDDRSGKYTVTHRLQRYRPDGTLLWDSGIVKNGKLSFDMADRDVALDSKDHVYMMDFNAAQVVKYGPDGNFEAAWGTPGRGRGQFDSVVGLALDGDGSVWVDDVFAERNGNMITMVDLTTCRFQRLSPDGKSLGEWKVDVGPVIPHNPHFYENLLVLPGGDLLLPVSTMHGGWDFNCYGPDLKLRWSREFKSNPQNPCLGADGNLYWTDNGKEMNREPVLYRAKLKDFEKINPE
jgi:sugar lactone lactonase YvrE